MSLTSFKDSFYRFLVQASTSRRKLSPSKEGTPRNAAGQAMGLIPWKGSSPQRSPFQNHYQLQNTSAVPQLNPHHQASPQSARRFNSSKGSYSRIGDPRANQVATRRLSDTAESIQVSMLLTRCHDHEAVRGIICLFPDMRLARCSFPIVMLWLVLRKNCVVSFTPDYRKVG